MNRTSDKNLLLEQFYRIIYVDFGIKELNDNLKNWYKLTWDEFRDELFKFKVRTHDNILKDWEYFFHQQKSKVLNSMN